MSIDIIGARFGRLTAKCQAAGMAPRFYLFDCACGMEKVASIADVRRGAVTSCGCAKRDHVAKARASRAPMVNDLTGRRFGMLMVVTRSKNNSHGCAVWRCACDCGTECDVSGNHLVTGNTASCGCARLAGRVVRPAEARAKSNQYVKNRYRKDTRYSINRRVLHLVHASLKSRGSTKSARWESLVGYTLTDLVKRLKRTMPKGWTWDDFMAGRLHIDHKTPLSAFNFTGENDLDFRRAWALSNLRLLPAAENLAKSDMIDGQFQPSLGF